MEKRRHTDELPVAEILGQGEQWFRALIEHSFDGIILLSGDGTTRYMSPSVQRILGYAPEESLRLTGLDFVHPDDQDGLRAQVAGLIEQPGASAVVQCRVRHKNRSWRWVEAACTNLLHEPSVQAIVINVRDISDRRQAEADSRRSRDELQAVFQSVADGITVQEPGGRLLYANAAAARIMGYASAEEVLTAAPDEALQRFSLFDAQGEPFPVDRLPGRLVLEGQPAMEAVLRVRVDATGEEHWSIVRAMPVKDDRGIPLLAVSAFQDITALKRSEVGQHLLAQASTLLASSLDPVVTLRNVAHLAIPELADVCVVDLLAEQGHLRRLAVAAANPRQEQHIWETAEQPLNANTVSGAAAVLRTGVSELVPKISDAMLVAMVHNPEDLQFPRDSGVTSQMIVALRACDRLLGLITFVSTRPGRRYAAADLVLAEALASLAATALDNARLYQEAQKAVRMRDEFLSSVSHDLKNPLTAIKGKAQLYRRRVLREATPASEQIAQAFTDIDAAATRIQTMIEELVEVSRLQLGHALELSLRPLDLVPLVRAVAEQCQQTTQRHTLIVQSDAAEIVGLWDQSRLE
ncbi:MAG: PAS domain-containing sensor histidine kinase [Dehalococcoidia bacterium]